MFWVCRCAFISGLPIDFVPTVKQNYLLNESAGTWACHREAVVSQHIYCYLHKLVVYISGFLGFDSNIYIPINHLCLLWTVWVSRLLFYNCLFFLLIEVVGSNATEWSLNQTRVLFSKTEQYFVMNIIFFQSLHPLQWSTLIIHQWTMCNISVTLTGNCYSFHYNWNLTSCFL